MNYKWEFLCHTNPISGTTERLRIPGGWLYREVTRGNNAGAASVAMVFVSIRDLRDDPDNVEASL